MANAKQKIDKLSQRDEPLFKRTTITVSDKINKQVAYILENSDITISALIGDALGEYDLDGMVKEIEKLKEKEEYSTYKTNSNKQEDDVIKDGVTNASVL